MLLDADRAFALEGEAICDASGESDGLIEAELRAVSRLDSVGDDSAQSLLPLDATFG